MFDFLKRDTGIIFLITVLFFTVLPFFFLHQGLLLIDTGREFYLPQQILNGSVLYKNLFNIYGPFSYLFNAVLFLIFGQKITVLYCAGILNSLLIVIGVFLISREFLKKDISFLLSIFIIFSLVYTTFLYNSNLTYSFAIVYALSSFLLSLLFFIKYLKTDNLKYSYSASFFAGISIANKYEFALYPFLIFFVLLFVKHLGIKSFLYNLLLFLSMPLFCFAVLIFQGFNFSDFKETVIMFNSMINAPSIKIFFSKFGLFFDKNTFLPMVLRQKIYAIFGFLPILNLLLFLFLSFSKKIYKNIPLFFFSTATILVSYKSFLFLNIQHMGVFLLPVVILNFIVLLYSFNINKNIVKLFLTAFILLFFSNDFNSLKNKDYLLNTSKGYIYTYRKDGLPISEVSAFLEKNSVPTDKVVVLPEGLFINFVANRQSDNMYYNFNPLFYNDVFGESKLLQHFTENKPEFFVLLTFINNIEYGHAFFGFDYAENFYEMILLNYQSVYEKNGVKIFKRKI